MQTTSGLVPGWHGLYNPFVHICWVTSDCPSACTYMHCSEVALLQASHAEV